MRRESDIDVGGNGPCAALRKDPLAVVVLVLGLAGAGLCSQPVGAGLLPEATVLSAADGKLIHADANDGWWFELTVEVKSGTHQIPAGTRWKLLPSSTLTTLIADVNDRHAPLYRLSAQVTRYKDANYLLATYFLPLSKFKTDDQTQDAGQGTEAATAPVLVDPELGIPPEILEKLKNPRRAVRGPLRKPGESDQQAKPAATRDYLGRMLVDRVGLIKAEDGGSEAEGASCYFVPYALGWNASDVRYELLPCSALEQAQRLQRKSLERIRFNVAGLVTQFEGRQYLLLQRAVPVYNYGNFSR